MIVLEVFKRRKGVIGRGRVKSMVGEFSIDRIWLENVYRVKWGYFFRVVIVVIIKIRDLISLEFYVLVFMFLVIK